MVQKHKHKDLLSKNGISQRGVIPRIVQSIKFLCMYVMYNFTLLCYDNPILGLHNSKMEIRWQIYHRNVYVNVSIIRFNFQMRTYIVRNALGNYRLGGKLKPRTQESLP